MIAAAARSALLLAAAVAAALLATCTDGAPFDWMAPDHFDEILAKMNSVTEDNCRSLSEADLLLPVDSVTNQPRQNLLKTSIFYSNRTNLLQMHSIALANAYKYSMLFQKLNETYNFNQQPMLFYYYFGLTADVSANQGLVNGSATFFDRSLFYPGFLLKVTFNQTIPLFGPRAYRTDNWNDPTNWLREPTNNTFNVEDYGAGVLKNYTLDAYKINKWYKLWLPQPIDENDNTLRAQFAINIRYSSGPSGKYDSTNFNSFTFFGPPAPALRDATSKNPVLFTQPYFDCGRSNRWIVSASAPIYDQLPRYPIDPNTNQVYENIRRYRRVGVAVTDAEFLRVDFNPCLQDVIFPESNYFAGTARCHLDTTLCKPLPGFGFYRGGYMCECLPGYRYPENIQGPYLGIDLERATKDEYDNGFKCLKIGDLFVVPQLNAQKVDNAGIDRIPGTIINKRASAEAAPSHAELRRRLVARSTTTSNDVKDRFMRSVVPRTTVSREEYHEQMIERRRVVRYDHPAVQEAMRLLREAPGQEHSAAAPAADAAGHGANEARSEKRRRLVSRSSAKERKQTKRKRRDTFVNANYDRVNAIINKKNAITKDTCKNYAPDQLWLPGDVKYGVWDKFQGQGRLAVRLANFLSNFYQNINPGQDYGFLRGDQPLTVFQIFSEVISAVMADPKVMGMGVFYEPNMFVNRSGLVKNLFGPYAFKSLTADSIETYYATDTAGEPTPYTSLDWYSQMKRRWSYNNDDLNDYVMNPWIRGDELGTILQKHEEYPIKWKAPEYTDGQWSDPYFDCSGFINDWILSYYVPFFGKKTMSKAPEFRGVVRVDVPLNYLDINQCPSQFYISNAFQSTARCNYASTYCKPIEGRQFNLFVGYRCDCRQGYEYIWDANEYFYTGDLYEKELYRKVNNITSRFDRLLCRMAGTTHLSASLTYTASLFIAAIILNAISSG